MVFLTPLRLVAGTEEAAAGATGGWNSLGSLILEFEIHPKQEWEFYGIRLCAV